MVPLKKKKKNDKEIQIICTTNCQKIHDETVFETVYVSMPLAATYILLKIMGST